MKNSYVRNPLRRGRTNYNYFFNKLFRITLYAAILAMSFSSSEAQIVSNKASYNIIPYPSELTPGLGSFTISNKTLLVPAADKMFTQETLFLRQLFQNYLGAGSLKTVRRPSDNAIVLKLDTKLNGPESYTIDVGTKTITLSAKDGAGMFYAIESLRQLLPASVETEHGRTLTVPRVHISDHPVLSWRGMMLDVSRHFFSIQYLKRFVDMMALYKLNKLHLHLTDDQGWRIEIKKYPKLTSEGAWRTFNNHDTACLEKASATGNDDFKPEVKHIIQKGGKNLYGGFYTQEEMRNFIRYAGSRHIEVIPEIDMPGHMMAATKIYPELTCDTLIGSVLGTFSNPICPCRDDVLEFAKNIFSEIADLFPSKYIHIGGDEVNKKSWENSLVIKSFMKQKQFKNIEQIQSYFNDYMQAYFKEKGKLLLGWDEIVEGGIDSSAAVMYWRGWAPEMVGRAAKNHNNIIMSTSGPLYFDAIPDALSLASVYNYNPLDPGLYRLDNFQKKYVVGVQANIWTEMIPSESRVDYMAMPRLPALAETGWSERKDYAFFIQRLNAQYERLDRLKINYRLPDIDGLVENYAVIGETPFFIASPNPRLKVHYTLNGAMPVATSALMSKPVMLNKAVVMKLALFTPGGRRGDVYTVHFNAQQYSQQKNMRGLKEGLIVTLHQGAFPSTTAIKAAVDSTFSTGEISIPNKLKSAAFGLKFKGYIDIPETGIYTFYLTCNDGGVLYIGDQQVIDNDGLHPDRTKGGQAGLQQGIHPLALNFMDYGGGYALELKYSYKGSIPQPIPQSWLKSADK